MATRLYQAKRPQKAPTKQTEWARLMQRAIGRAEKAKDRRLAGLRKAQADGKSEALLRRLGIISEEDLSREFPEKKVR